MIYRDADAYGFDLRSAEEMMEAERRETDLRRRLHPMSVVAREIGRASCRERV